MEKAVVLVDKPWPPTKKDTDAGREWEELCAHALLQPTDWMDDESYQLWAKAVDEKVWSDCPLLGAAGPVGGPASAAAAGQGDASGDEGAGREPPNKGLGPSGCAPAPGESAKGGSTGGDVAGGAHAVLKRGPDASDGVVEAAVSVLYHLARHEVKQGRVGHATEALFFADALVDFEDDLAPDDGDDEPESEHVYYEFLAFPPLLQLLYKAILLPSVEEGPSAIDTLHYLVHDFMARPEPSDEVTVAAALSGALVPATAEECAVAKAADAAKVASSPVKVVSDLTPTQPSSAPPHGLCSEAHLT